MDTVVFVGGRLNEMSLEIHSSVECVTNSEETYLRTGDKFELSERGDKIDARAVPITDILPGGGGVSGYDPYKALSAAVISAAIDDLRSSNDLSRHSAEAFLSKPNYMLMLWCEGAGIDMDHIVSRYEKIRQGARRQ